MQKELVDFSDCEASINKYDGAVYKHPIMYRGERYILKYGETAEPMNADQTSYVNSPLSEHLGSRCFEALGMPAQETILGTYHGHKVVACKDFIAAAGRTRYDLVEFRHLERDYVGWSGNILKTPRYENVVGVFDTNPHLAPIAGAAELFYWKMFLCDALLGNFDRHAGNWGYIYDNEGDRLVSPAPVYDCGSCLTPRLTEAAMGRIVADPDEMRARALSFPRACLLVNGEKPSYREFLESEEGMRCVRVAEGFVPSMDLEKVFGVINGSPGASDLKKEYLCKMVQSRYDYLLKPICGGGRKPPCRVLARTPGKRPGNKAEGEAGNGKGAERRNQAAGKTENQIENTAGIQLKSRTQAPRRSDRPAGPAKRR